MSHFCVLVIGENPEQQLAPYQENNMGDCPVEYLQFVEKGTEHKAEYDLNNKGYKTFDEFMTDYCGFERDSQTGKYGYWSNPNSKWDWFVLGGRYDGCLKLHNGNSCNQAEKKDVDLSELITFALVKEDKWYERGEMGWFASVANEKPADQWESEFKQLVENLPDETILSIYDCHI